MKLTSPLRKCSGIKGVPCPIGMEAHTKEDLKFFMPKKDCVHGHSNTCIPCRRTWERKQRDEAWKRIFEHMGGECKHCHAEDLCPSAYDLHHTDPTKKEKNIGGMLTCSWKSILYEIEKCILLCANCHRALHHKERREKQVDYYSNIGEIA